MYCFLAMKITAMVAVLAFCVSAIAGPTPNELVSMWNSKPASTQKSRHVLNTSSPLPSARNR